MLIIIKAEELFIEWRIISQNAGGVVVNVNARFDGFDDDAIFVIA